MSGVSVNKLAGWSMIIAAVLVVVGAAITPGYTTDSFEGLNMAQTLEDRSSDAGLHNLASLMNMAAGFLLLFGLYHIQRSATGGSVSDAFVRFGVVALAITIALLLAAVGVNKMIVHVLQHGGLEGIDAERADALAWSLQATRYGITIGVWAAGAVGTLLLGLGLHDRFAGGYQKWFALLVVVASIAGLAATMIAEFAHDIAQELVLVYGLYLLIVTIWYLLLGIALVNEESELTPSG